MWCGSFVCYSTAMVLVHSWVVDVSADAPSGSWWSSTKQVREQRAKNPPWRGPAYLNLSDQFLAINLQMLQQPNASVSTYAVVVYVYV